MIKVSQGIEVKTLFQIAVPSIFPFDRKMGNPHESLLDTGTLTFL